MSKQLTAKQVMNNNSKNIRNNYNRYKELVQDNIEIFFREFYTGLSENTAPLQTFFESLPSKDLAIVKQYMKAVSNIEKFTVNDKGNLNKPTTTDNQPIKANDKIAQKSWYDLQVKVTVTDSFADCSKMLSSFNSFVNKLKKSAQALGIQDKTFDDLESLKTQLESYKPAKS